MKKETNNDQIKYYAERAHEYERIYDKPERQNDLVLISEYLKNQFKNKEVIEAACGTGYWTRIISETAKSITAGDINSSVIEIAKTKEYKCPVKFSIENIYESTSSGKTYEAGFAGFIWSHVPRDELGIFIEKLAAKIEKGGKVIFIDNEYVEGNSSPISYLDESGNTYQLRKLEDGSDHKILKNFPTDDEIKMLLKPYASLIEIERLHYFWILNFITK